MKILKWSKKDLITMKDMGYKIIKCTDENDVEITYDELKDLKRCAQVGYILDSNDNPVYFICTKERAKKDE